jgi:formylglycine-generating enzyme required for sulfatase activity
MTNAEVLKMIDDQIAALQAAREGIVGNPPIHLDDLLETDLSMVLIRPPDGGAYLPLDKDYPTPVPMASTYWIGKYPVTNRLWRAVMGGTTPAGRDLHPVVNVTCDDAQKFCQKLSEIRGLDGSTRALAPFRLPTEWEWEWAAAGGVRVDGQVSDHTGWYSENSGGGTHPVGEKAPNNLGLYDTLGNVREWTASEYERNSAFRVFRGGSWSDDPGSARVADRPRYGPGARLDDLGFRLARG